MSEKEQNEPIFENKAGVVRLRQSLLLEDYRYWADNAPTSEQKARDLRIYRELIAKFEQLDNSID